MTGDIDIQRGTYSGLEIYIFHRQEPRSTCGNLERYEMYKFVGRPIDLFTSGPRRNRFSNDEVRTQGKVNVSDPLDY